MNGKTSHQGYFVAPGSIVRDIWGSGDTILFIFAGSAAEFALNKAVDWLYFTGRLPADPLGRLFSTVSYAREIVFSQTDDALAAIDRITAIHAGVEQRRGSTIPGWAYRDVLYMLIHYSIAAYELLHRNMTTEEKEAVYDVFYRMGRRMQLKALPAGYGPWLADREAHLQADLACSHYANDLFLQYRRHLGPFRFRLLVEGQKLVVPGRVSRLLGFNSFSLLLPVIGPYKLLKRMKADWLLKSLILPRAYKQQIKDLDVQPPKPNGLK